MRTRTISDSVPRLYMHALSLCLAKTITSLIETKTIVDRHFARGRSSRDETSSPRRDAARTAVDYRRLIARKSSAGSPSVLAGSRKRLKSEGRSPRSIYQNASGCATSLPQRRAHTTTKLSSRGTDIPFYPVHAVASYPLSSLRRGTHERVLGGLLYICMRIRKHAYMFAHTRSRSRPSNPLIGFIRASSITFSQGYTPSPSSDPTTRIYRGNFAPSPTQHSRGTCRIVINAHKFTNDSDKKSK